MNRTLHIHRPTHLPGLLALSALAGLLAVGRVTDALAAPGSALLSFNGLPQSLDVSPAIDKPPTHIAANEKVDGFAVAYPPKQFQRNQKPTYVMVAVNEALANPFTGAAANAEPDGTCFSQTMNMGPNAKPEWMPHGDARLTLMIPGPDNKDEPAVRAVRSERLVTTGEKASLDVTYVWIDTTTRGVRLIARETLALAPMATGPSGVAVFGTREAKSVQIVVKPSDASAASRRAFMFQRGMSAMGPDGRTVSSSCGHTRVQLRVEPQAAEMATFTGDVDLAPVKDPGDGPGSPMGTTSITETRQRPLRVSVSTSWMSRDKEPVLSVSFGWTGTEKSHVF